MLSEASVISEFRVALSRNMVTVSVSRRPMCVLSSTRLGSHATPRARCCNSGRWVVAIHRTVECAVSVGQVIYGGLGECGGKLGLRLKFVTSLTNRCHRAVRGAGVVRERICVATAHISRSM